jgi:hypothetical protein
MTDNRFDDIFKKRLENFNSKVPDDMWQRINKKDKDRKFFFIPRWYMIAALLALIGLAGYFTFTYTKVAGRINNQTDTANTVTEKENKQSLAEKNNASKDNATDTFMKDKNINTLNKNDKGTEMIISKLGSKKNQKKYTKEKAEFVSGETLQSNDQGVPDKNILKNNDSATIDQSADPFAKTTDKNINNNTSTSKDSSLTADEDDSPKKRDEEDNTDKFSLEIYASPDIPINNIHVDDTYYEQLLKDAGKMQLSFTIGARLDVRITKNLSGKIGVQYSQVNEKMSLTDSILSTGQVTYNNHYKSIYIPLLLSYNTKWPGIIHTSVNAGVLLNVNSKYKGAIPDISGNTLSLEHSNVYNQHTGISLYLGIAISKEINKKMGVFAEPYFLYRLKDMTNSIQPFTQRIHTAGISLGLQYRLFKKED